MWKALEWTLRILSIPFTLAVFYGVWALWYKGWLQTAFIILLPIFVIGAIGDSLYRWARRKGYDEGWDESREFHKDKR